MIYELAKTEDLQTVYDVVQHTIKTVYPKYYPIEVVDFFCEHHSMEAIAKDIEKGFVSILKIDGNIVATGCFVDNHITRVYVLPECQKKGYGTFIMKTIEAQIGGKYDKAYLDASLHNDVTAIEPDEGSIKERWADNRYTQIAGSTNELRKFDDETFDVIICYNVLEYAGDRADIVREFARILKQNGKISIVKHNRAGRVMQMVVLLNDFGYAHSLLDGNDGMASKYRAIRYYEDTDIEKWCLELEIMKTLGIRTFWDMQQNKEIHKDANWQDKMVEI